MRSMKRFSAAMLAATAATLAGLASAAALGVDVGPGAGPLRFGSTSAASCDPDGLRTAFSTAFDPGLGYVVTAVSVTGIDAACAGHRLSVALTDAQGAVAAQGGPVAVPVGGVSFSVPTGPVPVGVIARVDTLLE
jgi:hypothetical protein